MKIYTTLNIGDFHTNYCEDFWIEEQVGTNKKLIAVLDGCTMGNESVFASILLGKILRHTAKRKFYEEFITPTSNDLQSTLKDIIRSLLKDTRNIKNQLGLEINELLSTLIIGVIETQRQVAEFLVIGDGLIFCDGKAFEFEQNDKPDYLGYHLDDDFEYWYESQNQKLSISHFKDLSICSDGIFSFKNLKNTTEQKSESEILAYLLLDKKGSRFDTFLDNKIRSLKDHGHYVTDDLAIVRVIADS